METPLIKVGIMGAKEIIFTLEGNYLLNQSNIQLTGKCKATKSDVAVMLEYGNHQFCESDELKLNPTDPESGKFILHDVTIGINFHWERKEDQSFKGGLIFICENDQIQAINELSIEDYLMSVISSEMSATSSMELLKAHAVISRSWLLAQVQKNKEIQSENQKYQAIFRTDEELVKWYDREDHVHFDVCADDHCQRYQGVTRNTTIMVGRAVRETYGEILEYEGAICDARFSKCCGGVTEIFESAWEPVNHPYLQKLVDNDGYPLGYSLNLEEEGAATEWILGNPTAFCNSSDKRVLKQVLNDYDQETNDFFRWKVIYTQDELSHLIKIRSGIDFGTVTNLVPMVRGTSGRLTKLKIIGTLTTMVVGKELEIRKWLSKSHLYSSAFVIERHVVDGATQFILHGAGWGHGVGLCQIGAAVMGDKGYTYQQILLHYFRGAGLERRY